ncbi:hypothetical protein FISHEDRAFT_55553 [Fistulina hepatica ATCC 64428]|uniref:Uncharacterized protein n=1 Tax=Fistulina hepatica ATCC 64428 TaxID=1128425 RepID=A0A0D7AQ31_9AGAR|nr:hypothetical protein FISHEDRAFT_55553 [Fistulina hepatica ATCC 64428]
MPTRDFTSSSRHVRRLPAGPSPPFHLIGHVKCDDDNDKQTPGPDRNFYALIRVAFTESESGCVGQAQSRLSSRMPWTISSAEKVACKVTYIRSDPRGTSAQSSNLDDRASAILHTSAKSCAPRHATQQVEPRRYTDRAREMPPLLYTRRTCTRLQASSRLQTILTNPDHTVLRLLVLSFEFLEPDASPSTAGFNHGRTPHPCGEMRGCNHLAVRAFPCIGSRKVGEGRGASTSAVQIHARYPVPCETGFNLCVAIESEFKLSPVVSERKADCDEVRHALWRNARGIRATDMSNTATSAAVGVSAD